MRAVNGDPTKKKRPSYNDLVNLIRQASLAESTAVPNYAEQAFLNQQNSTPTLNPSRYRDEGVIREGGFDVGEDGKIIPENTMSLIDLASEPMKALDYYQHDSNREGGLPTRAEFDAFKGGNAYDMALASMSPAAAIQAVLDDPVSGLAAVTPIGRVGQVFKNAGIDRVDEAMKVINDIRWYDKGSQYGDEVFDAAQSVIDSKKAALEFADDAIPIGVGNTVSYSGGDYNLRRLADYALAESPEFAQNYNIGMLKGDEARDIARKFGEDYLTTYRAVDAKSPEQAAEYLTSPFGGGERIHGPGIYTINDPTRIENYGNYVGRLQSQPLAPGDARRTMGQLHHMLQKGLASRASYGRLVPREYRDRLKTALEKDGVSDPAYYMERAIAEGSSKDIPQRGALDDRHSVRIIRGTGEDRIAPILQQLVDSKSVNTLGGTPRWGGNVSPGMKDLSRYSQFNKGIYLTGEEQLMFNQGLKPRRP